MEGGSTMQVARGLPLVATMQVWKYSSICFLTTLDASKPYALGKSTIVFSCHVNIKTGVRKGQLNLINSVAILYLVWLFTSLNIYLRVPPKVLGSYVVVRFSGQDWRSSTYAGKGDLCRTAWETTWDSHELATGRLSRGGGEVINLLGCEVRELMSCYLSCHEAFLEF